MTTAVDRPNRAKLQQGIDIYRDHVREFIVRELGKRGNGRTVEQMLLEATRDAAYERRRSELAAGKSAQSVIDVSDFPHIVSRHWQGVFYHSTNGNQQIRNRMFLIAEGRNQVAHPDESDISMGYVYGRLDDISRVLGDIRAVAAAKQVDEIASQLYKAPAVPETPDQQRTEDQELDTKAPTKSNGLKPWREVIEPHRDVVSGEITNHTFAADLQRVADAESAYDEYTNPIEFFNRSYVTPGLESLLINTLKRINGTGGEPVIQMKTGFGGGKTHSLIALYHLINSGSSLAGLASEPTDPTGEVLRKVFDGAGVNPSACVDAKVVVLSGTVRSATEREQSEQGDRLNTLWGYMADKLGGTDGFETVREASELWTSPGGKELDELFGLVGPCVILIDELVAYARNLPRDRSASFYTFLQALTESAGRRSNVAIVVTVPEAAEELGGADGVTAQLNIERVLGRVESISAPLETHEAFEVVRRRLFDDANIDEDALYSTVNAFFSMYARSKKEYPDHAYNPSYLERLTKCYPIHPEIFDRLFEDWSAIHSFQRTRGVLRLVAIVIKRLFYERSEDPLILPANLRFDDAHLSQELIKLLNGNWDPAIQEIDGVNSRAEAVDDAVPRFRRYGNGAAKRVARTIMLGSVPASQSGHTLTGLTEDRIRLGTTQPGEGISVYNEARSRLTRDLYHLHTRHDRFFIHASPNLLKVHQDAVERIPLEDRDARIRLFIHEAVPRRIVDDVAIVSCPENTYEVRDDDQVKLVVLHPDHHLPSRRSETNTAEAFALEVLQMCGENPRIRRNMVTFLAAKRDSVMELRREIANVMAWEQLADTNVNSALSREQRNDARRHVTQSTQSFEDLLVSGYCEVIAPIQLDPKKAEFRLHPINVRNKADGDIARNAVTTLREKEELVPEIGCRQFDAMLKQHFLKSDDDHVEPSEIWHRLTEQVYMPRLVNRGVLETAIALVVKELDYCIADGFNEDTGYVGVSTTSTVFDKPRLLVRGGAVRNWADPLQEGDKKSDDRSGKSEIIDIKMSEKGNINIELVAEDAPTNNSEPKLTSVSASKTWTGQEAVDGDYNQVRDHIVKVVQRSGDNLTVTIIIEGENSEGFDRLVANTISENGDQLGIDVNFGSTL